jgi:ParB family transcriptional regulator, chromosome partitioning protein
MQRSVQEIKEAQLDLLQSEPGSDVTRAAVHRPAKQHPDQHSLAPGPAVVSEASRITGLAQQVPASLLYEDASNPRTEFADADVDELASDIRDRGILQPIVVHPADSTGHYRIHFGAMRLRAALKAGLDVVPIVVRDAAADPYAAVAENQKRRSLSPLDLARFIKGRAEAGESHAAISRKLGMDLTTVAHHLALLDLPAPVDHALKTGLCSSPRTLYELSKLHDEKPAEVSALIAGGGITRSAVAALKTPRAAALSTVLNKPVEFAKAIMACAVLEQALDKINGARADFPDADIADLRQRLMGLANRLA